MSARSVTPGWMYPYLKFITFMHSFLRREIRLLWLHVNSKLNYTHRERERDEFFHYTSVSSGLNAEDELSATPTATVRREPMRVLTACIGEKTNGGVIEAAYWVRT